jgi:hypothetical protein
MEDKFAGWDVTIFIRETQRSLTGLYAMLLGDMVMRTPVQLLVGRLTCQYTV